MLGNLSEHDQSPSKPPVTSSEDGSRVKDSIAFVGEARSILAASCDACDDSQPQKSYRTTLTLFTMAFGIFLYAIDMTIITNAVPKITAEFHTVNHIPWYGSAFFLTNAPFQSVWGKAFRHFETKRTYIASIFVFELGNLVAGAAPNSPALIAGRAIAGIGGAGIITGAFTIIALTAPPGKAPAYTAVMGITFGCASVLGPLLGGVFTDRLTWRWCFYINLPLGVLTAAMVALYIGEHKSDSEPAASLYEAMWHLDPVGTGLVLLSAGCFLTAMQFGSQSANWTQKSTVALLAASGVVALLFIIVEWRLGAKSMIQLRLLRQGAVAANAACIFFVSAVYFSLLYILPV